VGKSLLCEETLRGWGNQVVRFLNDDLLFEIVNAPCKVDNVALRLGIFVKKSVCGAWLGRAIIRNSVY